MRLPSVLLLILPSLTSSLASSPPAWGLWPLYTPLLGNISGPCLSASREFVRNTREALQTVATGGELSAKESAALAMFDSGGALPFLQEGRLSHSLPVDLCDLLAPGEENNAGCKALAPAHLRVLNIPLGAVTGPGTESQCREFRGNYCYNYFQAFRPASSAQQTSLESFLAPVRAPFSPALGPHNQRYIQTTGLSLVQLLHYFALISRELHSDNTPASSLLP